jgi:hypothetical protein
MDVKQPYQLGKDSLPILEPVTDPIDLPEPFIRWLSYENKRQLLLLEGYSQFMTKDRPNRQIILADAKAVMERWFENGVEYNDWLVDPFFEVSARALGIKIYTNEPPRLRSILENTAAVIRRHILEAKRIPVMNHLDVLIRCPRIVIDGRELKVGYGPYLVMPLPFGTVFKTEGLAPTKRAEMVAENWYDIQSQRLYRDITLVCNEGSGQWQPKSIAEVEHNYDYEQKLQTSDLTLAQQIELDGRYHRGLYFEEVQGALREIAINETLKDMRKSYEEIHEKWRR